MLWSARSAIRFKARRKVIGCGRIAMEWYGSGMSATTPHIVFSVSKSICGTLGGILCDRGLLDPEDRVTDYIPELAASVYAGCTVRHLLERSALPSTKIMTTRRATWCATAMRRVGIRCRSAKRRSTCAAYHRRRPRRDACSRRHLCHAARPHPLRRDDPPPRHRRRPVPGAWIDDVNGSGDPEGWARSERAEIFPKGSYRSQWYRIDRDRGVLVAFGIHGQSIYIHPQAKIVIVRMASEATPLDPNRVRGWRRGLDAIAEYFF
jgi:CubicO group peptidase (beta-lactamase class C family)